ncbi:MFS transporter [Talaromyces proteolyticus]|uniref:MFS transporter n=1 Tax=Talaromyces proteolyticus TaxID=1131652 RepID=A0AAD4PUT0_9EURO|nr:MFS transporter [Talaromyces proteolyticus]KAH8695456.1 MFS transporter [Talaromyces proteolyticus]
MLSFLRYRRLRQDLEKSIQIYGSTDDSLLRTSNQSLRSASRAPLGENTSQHEYSLSDGPSEKAETNLPTVVTLRNGQRAHIPGVEVVYTDYLPGNGQREIFLVGFDGENDQLNPKNWSLAYKWRTLGIVGMTGFLVGWASSIDSMVMKQAQAEFQVSNVTESLATALYLIAFAFGSLFAAPFSETFGRNPVYLVTLSLFMIFIMASGLSPNLGSQLAFRFIAGLFGCTPLTTFGGSMADIFDLLHRAYAFPVCCALSFLGPFLAPMVGAFIGQSDLISWRWSEWTTLILAGLITASIFFFVPETYTPVLLKWKAGHLRAITGDDRFKAPFELKHTSLSTRLMRSCSRPFELFFGELMVALFTIYLVVVYIVLFGFLTGYDFIYGKTYGFSQGSVGLAFIGMNVGFLIALIITPHVFFKYKMVLEAAAKTEKGHPEPEERLWFAMYGAPWLPISLFWMGWTSYPSISYWPSLVSSVAFGFAVQGIFISSYQYLIDTYEQYAASALVSATFFRYIAAGAMVIVSLPMYKNLGVHWSLTLLGCISLVMTPVPYVFYKYGRIFRQRSKNAAV